MGLSNVYVRSATNTLIAIYVGCTLFQAKGEISSPGELNANAGQNVTFMFNSTGKIAAVKFGLDNGQKYPVPKFITVIVKTNGETDETCGDDLDNSKAAKYKRRVFYVGDLIKGHAWFNLTNLTIYDAGRYSASIREDHDDNYKQEKTVNLYVNEATTEVGTTSPPKFSEPRFNKFEGVGKKAYSSHVTSQEEQQTFISVIKKAYENTSGTYEISISYFRRKKELWIGGFDISFTTARNQTYALSFLQKASKNNKLGGYNITCFDPDLNVERVNESIFKNSYLIAFFVSIGLILILAPISVILLKCHRDLRERIVNWFYDLSRRSYRTIARNN